MGSDAGDAVAVLDAEAGTSGVALPEEGASVEAARADAFVSYSHRDTEFVEDVLLPALEARGKKVWLDRTDIPGGSPWPERIRAGIEAARTFVFVITPASVASRECLKELVEAAKLNKPLIPVRRVEVPDLPAELREVQWIAFGDDDPLEPALEGLFAALEDDLEWRDLHNEYGIRAREWARQDRDSSLLLRGRALAVAEQWEGDQKERDESPTAEQVAYILASRRASSRRRQIIFGAVLAALFISSGLGVVAWLQRNEARSQARDSRSRRLAVVAAANLDRRYEVGLLLALEAYRASHTFEARSSLLAALQRSAEVTTAFGGGPVQDVAISPDGSLLAVAAAESDDSPRGAVQLWDAHAARPRGPAFLRGETPTSVDFSPDGRLLAVAVRGQAVLVDVPGGRIVGAPLRGRGETVVHVAFSPDGALLATSNNVLPPRVRFWTVTDHRLVAGPLRGPGWLDTRVAFDRAGETLVSTAQGTRLWDPKSRRFAGRPLQGTQRCCVDAPALSPDGKLVAATAEDNTLRFWDARTGRLKGRSVKGAGYFVSTVAFSPNGKILASLGDSDAVRLWDVAARAPLGPPLAGTSGSIESFAFSRDGRSLASGSDDGTVRLWDITRRWRVESPLGRASLDTIGRDGTKIAARTFRDFEARSPVRIGLWDLRNGRVVRSLETRLPLNGDVTVSPDEKTFAVGRGNGTVWLFDATGHRSPRTLTGPQQLTQSVAFSRDGALLAGASRSGAIDLWRLRDGRRLGRALQSDALLTAVAFGPKRVLAAAGEEGTIVLWDADARRRLGLPLEGPPNVTSSLSFTPDESTLASANANGTIQLWDVRNRRPLGDAIDASGVGAVGFASDGRTLVSASRLGSSAVLVRRWSRDLWTDDPAELIARGCALATRNLNRSEWREFIPDQPYRQTCER